MEHKIAVMISGYISGAGDRSDLERIKILYGIEVFLNNFLKLCVLLILGFFGGILREVILVFLSFGFIREKAGGLHCRSNAACWILSMTRTAKLLPGKKSDFLFVADSGPGEQSGKGLIVPKFGANPENHISVSMTWDSLSELFLLTKANHEAWLAARYLSMMMQPAGR